jgi:hypothetical protein
MAEMFTSDLGCSQPLQSFQPHSEAMSFSTCSLGSAWFPGTVVLELCSQLGLVTWEEDDLCGSQKHH